MSGEKTLGLPRSSQRIYTHSLRVSRLFRGQWLFLPLGLGTCGILRFHVRLEQVFPPSI